MTTTQPRERERTNERVHVDGTMKNLLHTLALFIIKWHTSPIKNESTAEISLRALFNFTLNIYCCHTVVASKFLESDAIHCKYLTRKYHLREMRVAEGYEKGYIESDKCGFQKITLVIRLPKKIKSLVFLYKFSRHHHHHKRSYARNDEFSHVSCSSNLHTFIIYR